MQSLIPKDDEPIRPQQPIPQNPPTSAPAPAAPSYLSAPPAYQPPPHAYPPPQGYQPPQQGYQPPPQQTYQPPPQQTYQQPVYQQPQPAYTPPAPQPQSSSSSNYVIPGNTGSGAKIPILFGIAAALALASAFLFYQVSQLRNELGQTREALLAEITKANETSAVSVQTSRRHMEDLQKELLKARQQAAALSGEAKEAATKHADDLAAKLEREQAAQAKQLSAVGSEVNDVKTVAAATSSKVGEVSTEVGSLKTDTAKNKSDIEKTIADLKTARGDLGVQSGLIATNSKELAALRQLGERNYIDFKLAKGKGKQFQKVGDIQVLLESTDPKKNKFSIVILADDKRVEKKDRTVNEPVQFMLSKAMQPYELVVNDVKKDLITGYLAAPKVQSTRN